MSTLSKCFGNHYFCSSNLNPRVYIDHHLRKLKSCHLLQSLAEVLLSNPSYTGRTCLLFRKESLTCHFLVIKHLVMVSIHRVPVFTMFLESSSLATHISKLNLPTMNPVELHILSGTFLTCYDLTLHLFCIQSPSLASSGSGRPWIVCMGSSSGGGCRTRTCRG